MKNGARVIAQGALTHQGWGGRADILRRVEVPSAIGNWSYEALDTKLARETKAGAVLQLCLYSDLLAQTQGTPPEYMYVVAPWSDFQPRAYRFADYAAYFRKVKLGLVATLREHEEKETYPDPKPHCDICRWRKACERRRRDDDHLCLVAGISKVQINELQQRGITTMKALSGIQFPLGWKPNRGSVDSYNRLCEQARLQVEARETGELKHIVLAPKVGFGLTRLPEPSDADIFLDLEGDPFVGEHGLEYLFGYRFHDENGQPVYQGEWAFTREEEKRAFQDFVDFVMARWEAHPNLHIYHYAPYEPSAMKRLMGRYATREEEIDRMLRARLFVDLFQVVRHAVRASVESYSIKHLEPFYGFERKTDLADANIALANVQANLELDDVRSIGHEAKAVVQSYNKDDCDAAAALRDWLEGLRTQLIADGANTPRPEPGDGAPDEKITDWLIRINALIEKLTFGVPADPQERTKGQQALWILANVLDWHRREEKAVWWELFRLSDLSAEDLLDEPAGLSGLTFIQNAGGTVKAPIHRYSFPPQETQLRGGEEVRCRGCSHSSAL
jgi:predicted RecB family nuclease